MAHNYRTAKRGESLCQGCKWAKKRPLGGRLECPKQGNYMVGNKSVCDAHEEVAR